ncbi:hypothetical protein EN947_29815, partial [Mesorhizobium sp. M7A.F.Ca.US.003.02.2.1]
MALPDGSYERLRAAGCAGEVAYVQACLRLFFAGPGAGDVSMRHLDGEKIAEIARLNKVAVFVLKALSRAPALQRPTKLFQWLDTYRRKTVSMNASCIMDSMAIQDVLRASEIDFVFLKGPFQQQLLYDDHFMKPSGDVD